LPKRATKRFHARDLHLLEPAPDRVRRHIAGLVAGHFDRPVSTYLIWSVATAPVAAVLAISIFHDLIIGRLGIDAIALVAMVASIAMGEPLAGTVVAMMYSGANLLENYARGKAERELRSLRDRSPKIVPRREAKGLVDIAAEEVRPGDELLVRGGELLPVDGELLDVRAKLDESAVTGVPLPETRSRGDLLRSGTGNVGEAFRYRTAAARESTYAGIVRMVEVAQTAKAPFMRMAERFCTGPAAGNLTGRQAGLVVVRRAHPRPCRLRRRHALPSRSSRRLYRWGLARRAFRHPDQGQFRIEALGRTRTAIFDKTGTFNRGRRAAHRATHRP
jgi:cation transport ATPase